MPVRVEGYPLVEDADGKQRSFGYESQPDAVKNSKDRHVHRGARFTSQTGISAMQAARPKRPSSRYRHRCDVESALASMSSNP